MSDRYPNYVDSDEKPEATPENVPEGILRGAISIAVTYKECQHCGEQQFMNVVPGHNNTHECVECEETLAVIG